MAKKAAKSGGNGSNKSQSIRDYINENPGTGPKGVAEALNAREGWKISPAYVSTIKNKMNQKSGKKRGRRGAGRPARSLATPSSVNEKSLIQAKQLIDQAGGVNQARAALDLLAKLQS
jgi:hypothetical protein